MTRTLDIADELVEDARALTGEDNEVAAVERVLRDALEGRRKNATLLDLAGAVEFFEGYDPKSLRFFKNDPG